MNQTRKPLLDRIEKAKPAAGEIESPEEELTPGKLLLVISYKGDEYETFELNSEVAKTAVELIMKNYLATKEPFIVFLHNDLSAGKPFLVGDNVDDFRGAVQIDESFRSVRLVNPKGLKD